MSVREALMLLRRVRLVTCGGNVVDEQLTFMDERQRKLLELCGCSEDMASGTGSI